MDNKELVRVCLALFPDAEHLYGQDMLVKDPDLAMRVTALHVIASGADTSTLEFQALRSFIMGTYGAHVQQARDARNVAREAANLEGIRASIRQKKTNQRRGRPGHHELTDEENAVDLIDGGKA